MHPVVETLLFYREMRIAAVTFGTTPYLEFNLGDAKVDTIDKAIKAIDDITYSGGATATTDALTLVKDEVAPFARKESDRVMIFITDGKSNVGDSRAPYNISMVLQTKYHFEVYAIGKINCHHRGCRHTL